MASFKSWSEKQSRPYQLVLWHTHYPGQWIPPESDAETQAPCDCAGDALFLNRVEAIAKNNNPNEAIVVADNTIEFTDALDLEAKIEAVNNRNSLEAAMMPNDGYLTPDQRTNLLILGPAAQRFWGNEQIKDIFGSQDEKAEDALDAMFSAHRTPDVAPKTDMYEKDWTESDFLDWTRRAAWEPTESEHHERTTLNAGATLPDLYKAAMFLLRNGQVHVADDIPLMIYRVENRWYWLGMSYNSIGRTVEIRCPDEGEYAIPLPDFCFFLS